MYDRRTNHRVGNHCLGNREHCKHLDSLSRYKESDPRKQTLGEELRLSLSVDLGLKLDERFNSERFCKIRLDAAQALLGKGDLVQAEEVFDFFDTVGELLKQGALSEEIVHSLFFHWINLYWNAAKDYIGKEQQGTALVWQEFETAYKTVLQIERRKDPNSKDINPTAEHIREQLKDELHETS